MNEGLWLAKTINEVFWLVITTHLPCRDVLVGRHHSAPGLKDSPAELSAKSHGGAGDDEVGIHFMIRVSEITQPSPKKVNAKSKDYSEITAYNFCFVKILLSLCNWWSIGYICTIQINIQNRN